MIKLSIGIPVYNQVDTIAETIESILRQTLAPFEIVVSENHSTDGTREVINKYADRLTIVSPPSHLSMAGNRNYCVRMCSGDWVGLCSGDDLLLPNYSKTMSSEIEKFPNAIFFMGGWINNLLDKGIKESRYLMSMGKVTSYPNTVKMLLEGPKASFAAFCFNRDIFDKVGGYDESFHLIQDWILQFDMAFIGNFIRVDELVAEYRITNRGELEKKRVKLFIDDFIQFLLVKLPLVPNEISKRYINKVKKIIIRRIFSKALEMNPKSIEIPLDIIKNIAYEIKMQDEYELFTKHGQVKSEGNSIKKFIIIQCRRIIASRKKIL
jgi:glycosyltransferase involved in cell wall biosynthesis